MTVLAGAALATVFGVATGGKLTRAGFREFRDGVGRLWFGPGRLSPSARHLLAVGVLVTELSVAGALAVGTAAAARSSGPGWTVPGLAGAAVLLGVFTVAHAVAVVGRRAVPCACFGRTATVVGPLTLARSAVLFGLALAGLLVAVAGGPVRTSGPAVLLGLLGGVALALLLVGLEDLVSLFRPLPPAGGARTDARRGGARTAARGPAREAAR